MLLFDFLLDLERVVFGYCPHCDRPTTQTFRGRRCCSDCRKAKIAREEALVWEAHVPPYPCLIVVTIGNRRQKIPSASQSLEFLGLIIVIVLIIRIRIKKKER